MLKLLDDIKLEELKISCFTRIPSSLPRTVLRGPKILKLNGRCNFRDSVRRTLLTLLSHRIDTFCPTSKRSSLSTPCSRPSPISLISTSTTTCSSTTSEPMKCRNLTICRSTLPFLNSQLYSRIFAVQVSSGSRMEIHNGEER